jgi:DNA adenine methylase
MMPDLPAARALGETMVHAADPMTRRLVAIENRPALKLIASQDTPETLFYVDPPYVHSTRGSTNGERPKYRYEMTDADHRTLASVLQEARGMVVVSGYACDLYDVELYPSWERREVETHADGARDRTEVLWLNPACSAALRRDRPQLSLMEAGA